MKPPHPPAQDSLEKVSSHEAKPDMGESGSLDEKSGADFDILVTGLTSQDRENLTEEEAKKLLRRIDLMVVPIMALLYGLQYLDKILINYAAVMGFKADTGMDTDKYSYLAMIFYISYVVFEFPHSWGIQKFPVAKYLSTMVILWGVVVTVTCACKNYAGLVATRVLLGIFEAAVAPALIIITTMWFTTKEQPLRTGIWYSGCSIAGMSGGLISFGFQHYTGKEFKSWQIMFLVVGLFTVASGILAFMLLPDSPLSSRLSPREKYHAIERVRANQTGIENKTWKWYQFRECLCDPQTWIFMVLIIANNTPNGSMSNFQATVIASFGFTNKEAALLNMGGGATNLTTCLIASYLATRYNQRFFSFIALILLGLTGGCLIAFLPAHQRGAKLFGMYLCNCTGAATPVTYSWISANYAGHTKKVTMSAILLICFSIGNIIGPLTFRTADEPDFIPAKVTIIVMCALAITCASVLKFYYLWENRRRDRLGSDGSLAADVAFADLTDRENLKFRYRV